MQQTEQSPLEFQEYYSERKRNGNHHMHALPTSLMLSETNNNKAIFRNHKIKLDRLAARKQNTL
jgi:hypothetical protein